MRNNIAIAGAVKSRNYRVAMELFGCLDMFVLDCDGYIEYEIGSTISQMVADNGREHFYQIEERKLAQLSGYDNAIFALSPTCLGNINNMRNISEFSYIITLMESRDSAHNSLMQDDTLTLKSDVINNLDVIYNNLTLTANQFSQIVIDINDMNVSDIVQLIIAKLGEIVQ